MGLTDRLRSVAVLAAVAAATVTGAGLQPAAAQVAPACQPYGAIGAYWQGVGAERSFLGTCTKDEHAVPGGRATGFGGGTVYWSAVTGAHSVKGLIRDGYTAAGATGSFLGFPTTDEAFTPRVFGAFNHFQGGSLYWSPGTGVREVHGSIRDKWAALGWEGGALGFPTTGEAGTPTKAGAFNHFQGGSIYWSPATGAHEVRGAIRERWAGLGWETSALGFPTSDEYVVAEGRRTDFQGGSVIWTAASNTTRVVGAAATPSPPPAAESKGKRALAVAHTKLGARYVWGGNGPTVFDCSGLTSWAFRQVGVTLPRVAADQAKVGTYVDKSNLQAGDLVFFYSPVTHVGIYDGNGNVLNAPTEGQGVQYTPIKYLPYTTARRM
ncbi:NlpC/P60 family protein [Rhodococcus sp. X156]|uniref:NlpC/P60 family protein n=1 Tax=Rhodococcus sp. X156 TaxID=2499145 RepID=UPI000FD8B640|nr:NlpC/P60 family protein [Rhodococcus sp. X156]